MLTAAISRFDRKPSASADGKSYQNSKNNINKSNHNFNTHRYKERYDINDIVLIGKYENMKIEK